mgnify:FL=1
MGWLSDIGRFFGIGGEPSRDLPTRSRLPDGTVIADGFAVKGELSGTGDLQILGSFEGQITLTGTVLVEEGALVDANIFATAIVIGGVVRGNLSAAERVEILPTGVLTGTLKSGSLTAAEGASVKGEVWVERHPVSAMGGSNAHSESAQ